MKRLIAMTLSAVLAVSGQTKVDYPSQVKNGPVVVDTAYATLALGCAAAVAAHASLNVTLAWLGAPTTVCNTVVNFAGSVAKIRPANGATFTVNGYTAVNRQQVWDVSVGGHVRVSATGAGTVVYAGNFSAFSGACETAAAAAITGGSPLVLNSPTTVSADTVCAANVTGAAGGLLTVNSAVNLSFTGAFSGTGTQHFDLSAGGHVDLSSAKIEAVSPLWFGATGDGSTVDYTSVSNMFASSSGQNIVMPPGTYYGGSSFGAQIAVTAKSLTCSGSPTATFTGGWLFLSASSITVTGCGIDTSAIAGTGGSPVWLAKGSHSSFFNNRITFEKNYTAIQIGTTGACPTDIVIDGLATKTSAESHVTVTCVDGLRVSNWLMDGGDESGFVLQPIAGPIQNVSASNITANGVADLMQIAGGDYILDNVTLTGATCRECLYFFQEQDFATGTAPHTNVTVSNASIIDTTGVLMDNLINISTSHVPHRNYIFSDLQGWGQFHTGASSPGWIKISATSGTVPFSNFLFKDLTLITGGSGGTSPGYTVFFENDTNWTGFVIDNVTSNASTGYGLQLNAAFATQADLIVRNSHFSGLQSGSPATAAHLINTSAIWYNNTTVLNANEPELISVNAAAHPLGISFATLTSNTYTGAALGSTPPYCYDCSPTNPATGSGSGAYCTRITGPAWSCGTAASTLNPYCGGLLTFGGADNVLTTTGSCALTAGLVIQGILTVLVGTAGSTLNYNVGGALPIKRATNPSADVGTGFAVNGVMTLIYADGVWEVVTQ